MPVALLQWMDSMDLALSRRLRNLSHAVNVQLCVPVWPRLCCR
jgi:hypothetical protein